MDLRKVYALIAVCGGVLLTAGAALVYLPAGLLVAGFLLLAAGLIALREAS